MKKLILIPATLTTLLTFAACGGQTQNPQVDDRSGTGNRSNQPETITVYRDGNDGRSGGQAAADQNNTGNRSGNGSQGGGSQSNGGVIVADGDPDDGSDPDADENMQRGQQLPADFPVPIPEDYRVQAVGNVGSETSAVLSVPSGEDAYNYYRQALADAGFRVVDEGRNQSGFFEAELEFSNNNLEGNIDFNGNTVEIDVERYG